MSAPRCNCDALGVANRVHAFQCPVAQAAMAELEQGAGEGVTLEQMRDRAKGQRDAALAQLTPAEREAVEAKDKLTDAQIIEMARDLVGVLQMYNVTRNEARRIIARMGPIADNTPANKWKNPLAGSGMSVIKGEKFQ